MPKHVLITGGTGGIGKALVSVFAEAGYRVSFTYHKSVESASEISKATGANAFSLNLENTEEVLQFAKRFLGECGSVDVLVNNAGISHYGLFQDVTQNDFRRLFSVNFESVFFLTQALIPSMISSQSGSIINIGSIWGETGASCEVLYSSAKGALNAFTKALAKELAPSGISVNCISPGVVDTAMMSRFSEEDKIALRDEIPAGHFTDPSEVASLALYLANHPSTSMTGQIFGMNGGLFC